MMTAYVMDSRYQPGAEMIAENHNLKQRVAELEEQLARLARLNLLLNAEVETARRANEARLMEAEAARDAQLWEIVDRHTAMLHERQHRAETARNTELSDADVVRLNSRLLRERRSRAGVRREWR